MEQIYYKHKIFGLRQLKNNNLTNNLYLYFNRYYSDSENIKQHSFISQVNDLKTFTSTALDNLKATLEITNNRFQCNDLNNYQGIDQKSLKGF